MTIQEQYEAAEQKLNTLQAERRDFVRKAEDESHRRINAEADSQFSAAIQTAAEEFAAAEIVWLAEKESEATKNAPHPIGTKYVHWVKEDRWGEFGHPANKPRKWIATSETAVLEVVTRESKFADNLSRYSRPEVGNLILRVIKKNGELGLKFVQSAYFIRSEWRVPIWYSEGEDPNQAEEAARKSEEKQKAEE